MARAARGSLSREAVLDAALIVVDREGLAGLSVRGLARELGRPPMTLYAHFRSKEELLDLLFERLFRRLFSIHHHASWRGQLEESSRQVRRELLEHPNWVPLLTRVTVPGKALEFYEHVLALMYGGGFVPEAAVLAVSAVLSHALGAVLVERMLSGTTPIPVQRLELVKAMVASRPHGARPVPAIEDAMPEFGHWSFDAVFDLGLHSLLAGLDESLPRSVGHRRPA
jgi:AcrR family transcriptional regulator